MFVEEIDAALKKRVVLMGIDPDETICYQLSWADVLDVLARKLAKENVDPDALSNDELNAILDIGQDAAETLPSWHDTLAIMVNDAWNKIRPKHRDRLRQTSPPPQDVLDLKGHELDRANLNIYAVLMLDAETNMERAYVHGWFSRGLAFGPNARLHTRQATLTAQYWMFDHGVFRDRKPTDDDAKDFYATMKQIPDVECMLLRALQKRVGGSNAEESS